VIFVVGTIKHELLSKLYTKLVTHGNELGDVETWSRVDDSSEDLQQVRRSINANAICHDEGLDRQLGELGLDDVESLTDIVVVHQLFSLDLSCSLITAANEVSDLSLHFLRQIRLLLLL